MEREEERVLSQAAQGEPGGGGLLQDSRWPLLGAGVWLG